MPDVPALPVRRDEIPDGESRRRTVLGRTGDTRCCEVITPVPSAARKDREAADNEDDPGSVARVAAHNG